MIPPWLVDGRTLRTLSRIIVAAASVGGLGVTVCLGRTYWAANQLNQANARHERASKAMPEVQAAIERANRLTKPKTPDPKAACNEFQDAAQNAARACDGKIGGFDTSPEVQTYLSKYTNDSPPEGWKQVVATFSISGSAKSVFDTLDLLRKTDIPFEIDNIEINRASTDPLGTSTVLAQIQARVLMRA